MNEMAFVEKREPDWKRLTFLCDRADATIKNLKPEELHEFVRLYRRVSADLALVRQGRLSVVAVPAPLWKRLTAMGTE